MNIFKDGTIIIDDLALGRMGACDMIIAGHYSNLRHPVGTCYQVPAGKKCIIGILIYTMGSANGNFSVGYGDSCVYDSVTAPTNWKVISSQILATVAGVLYEKFVFLEFPALKYPTVQNGTSNLYLTSFGVEVPA